MCFCPCEAEKDKWGTGVYRLWVVFSFKVRVTCLMVIVNICVVENYDEIFVITVQEGVGGLLRGEGMFHVKR
jgi:hypothetical protein